MNREMPTDPPPSTNGIQLNPIERRILDALNEDSFALTAYDLVLELDEDIYPSGEEIDQVTQCLTRLENAGLVMSWETQLRDIGIDRVWKSLEVPRQILDPGG
ncbi:hypothetical protein [Nocardia fluminea]|uniref:hypothetical protein n=1 Tax=Nocardia fluminea TaxID=134984 RepID=UPI003432881E